MLNFGRDQADGLRKMVSGGAARSRLITFLSGNTSVDNALLLTNLGASLVATGSSVLLIDARSGARGLSTKLGVNRSQTLWDAAFKDAPPSTLMQDVPGSNGVQIVLLGGPRGNSTGSMEINHFNNFVSAAIKTFDMVLVDGELTAQDRLPLLSMESGEIVIQVSPTSASITSAYGLMKKLTGTLGRRPYSILVTGVTETASKVVYDNMAKTASQYLAVPLSSVGSVPADDHLQKASSLGRTVVDAFPLAGVSVAFRQLAGRFSAAPLAASV